MEKAGDYYEEFEAITNGVIADIPSEESNPLNEFATDVTLSEVERVRKYAFSLLPAQRYTFIKNIKTICENGNLFDISSTIIPILDRLTSDRDNSIRQITLNQFEYIANLYFEKDYYSAIQFITTVAFPILKLVLLDGVESVQKAAINAFVSCCKHIHREDQGIHTYLFILQFAHSTSRDERIMACKLFQHTASILGSEIISQFGVSEVLSLVRDPYCQVRKHAILALGPISDVLDSEIIEQGIYNALLTNTKSPSWVIRRACAIVIPEVFKNIHSHKIFLSITKPIGELFRDENPYVKQAMLQSLGHVISVIPDHFNINDDIKTRYLQLGNTKDDLPSFLYCRCCAFYFPSVLRALSSSAGFWKDMNDLYNRLSRHTDMIVRRSLAYSLHEVAEVIGVKNTEKSLVTVQARFLKDVEDVRTGVIKNMAKFWKSLTPATRTIQAFELSVTLSQLKESRNWRLRLEISRQLTEFCELLIPKNVLEVLAPIYLDLIQDPVEIVRTVATEATYPVLNKAIEADNKSGIVLVFRLITLAKSEKYNTREMFILCCPAFTKLLSKHSFKEMIRPVIQRLAKDPVPNVRECVLHMILNEPKKAIRKLYGFKKIMSEMMKDEDSEILRVLSAHPLTKELYGKQVKEEKVMADDLSIIIEESIFSGEDSLHISNTPMKPQPEITPIPVSFNNSE